MHILHGPCHKKRAPRIITSDPRGLIFIAGPPQGIFCLTANGLPSALFQGVSGYYSRPIEGVNSNLRSPMLNSLREWGERRSTRVFALKIAQKRLEFEGVCNCLWPVQGRWRKGIRVPVFLRLRSRGRSGRRMSRCRRRRGQV